MVKNIFIAVLALGFSFGNPFYVFAEDVVVQEVENNDQIQEIVIDEEVEEEDPMIFSCEDVIDSEDLLVYLSQFDGDPNCFELPTISHDPHFDIFPGQTVNDVVVISLDGVEYSLPTLPNFTLGTVDEVNGFLQGTFSFPYYFPNWGDGENPTQDVPVIILLTFHPAETPTEEPEPETSGGGGGSSSGFKRNSGNGGDVLGAFDQGEVLGESTTSCPVFSGFYRKGDTGEGVKGIQTFLNQHMNAGLAVDGIFGPVTEKAVHAFQQKYWAETIKPWTPALSSRTTGRWYKTTSAWANILSGCTVEPMLLEDTGAMFDPSINGWGTNA